MVKVQQYSKMEAWHVLICYHLLVLHNNDMHCGCIGNKNWGQIDQIQFV